MEINFRVFLKKEEAKLYFKNSEKYALKELIDGRPSAEEWLERKISGLASTKKNTIDLFLYNYRKHVRPEVWAWDKAKREGYLVKGMIKVINHEQLHLLIDWGYSRPPSLELIDLDFPEIPEEEQHALMERLQEYGPF